MFLTVSAFANDGTEIETKDFETEHEEAFNVNDMIMHHIADAHEYHLWGGTHDGTSIYLPIILIDGGLKDWQIN